MQTLFTVVLIYSPLNWMNCDSSGLFEIDIVQNRSSHSPKMIDVCPDHFDGGPGTVDKVQQVADPIVGHALDRLQIGSHQNLRPSRIIA
jgi:hypothetical protein